MSEILQIEGLDLYGTDKNISSSMKLTLNSHDIYALVGEGKVGKTALLSIISGMRPIQEGIVRIDGIVNNFKQVSIAFQYSTLYPYLPVVDNIQLLSTNIGATHRIIKKLFDSPKIFLSKKVYQLSNFEKQMICLAICLSKSAKIYLLDEPFKWGQENEALLTSLKQLILQFAKQGCCFLITSNRWNDVDDLFNRLGMFYEGRLIAEYDLVEERKEDYAPSLKMTTTEEITCEVINLMDEVFWADQIDANQWIVKLHSQHLIEQFTNELVMQAMPVEKVEVLRRDTDWSLRYFERIAGEEDV